MGEKNRELGAEELGKASGGSGFPFMICRHKRREKTGNEREESRYYFTSQRQLEYRCQDCGKLFWVDE